MLLYIYLLFSEFNFARPGGVEKTSTYGKGRLFKKYADNLPEVVDGTHQSPTNT
jgi:hypothetical protein